MFKKIASPVLIILGIVFFVFGSYISSQVSQGEQKIQRAERGVNHACSLTKVDPLVHKVGKVFTTPIRDKIADGKQEASKYKKAATWLHISGIVLFVLGIAFIFLFNKRKKN